MGKRFVDLSDYQAGLNIDAAAAAVDGVWCKVGDWAWIARYGPPGDNIHDQVIARCLQLGKPVGSYLFVRPGQTDPATQINWWRANCPDGTTVAPMIDLEKTVITGSSLRDWISEALTLTAKAFGVTPVLYWSATFANAYGMSAPDAPHIPMFAEYHYGYQTQLWQNVNSWEAHAYSAFGGPDVPPGYSADVTSRSAIWQWTSSAQLPGFLGLVDCDLVSDAAFQLITDGSLGPSSVDDIEAIMADPTLAADLRRFISVFGLGGEHNLADVWNRTLATYDATNVAQYGWKRLDGSAADTLGMWALNLHERMTAQSLNPLSDAIATVDADVKALSTVGVDVDALAAKIVALVTASGIHADVDEAAIAKAAVEAFRSLFAGGSTTGGTGVDPPTVDDVPVVLPDPSPDRRAEIALADLTRSVFDSETGIVSVVAGQLDKMSKTADGAAPTPQQVRDAFEAAAGDATQRAAYLAATVPVPDVPAPVEPTAAGDMTGHPDDTAP